MDTDKTSDSDFSHLAGTPLFPLLLALEERILLDAAGAGDLIHLPTDHPSFEPLPTHSPALGMLQALAPTGQEVPVLPRRREVVFVDGSVTDYPSLLAGLSMESTVVALSPGEDGVARIMATLAALAQQGGVDAIHIIAHGADGLVRLGGTELSLATLADHAESLKAWGAGLRPEGDILFYGCDVARGETGLAFIRQVAELTGADVAASDNLTGAARMGGDWVLEQATGPIETLPAPSVEAREAYGETLATYTVSNLNNTGAGSLRNAIASANATVGTDTIQFTVTGTITLTSMLTVSDPLIIQGDTNGDQVADIKLSGGGASIRGIFVNMSAIANALTLNSVTVDNFDPVVAGGVGGALYIGKGTLNLDHSTISNSSVTFSGGGDSYGGGIYLNANGVLNLTDSNLTANAATFGAGIRNDAGAVTVTRSTISGNTAVTGTSVGTGGGIYQATGGSLTITDSTISGNSATGTGGGIIVSAGTVSIDNTTIAGNSGTTGGGLRILGGTVTMTNSTVAANVASTAGGGVSIAAPGTLSATNSLFADNTGTNPDISGAITANYSLIENTTGATITTTTSNVTGVDPVLGSLASNGGSTRTMALGVGSPAIDQWSAAQVASLSVNDQRGTGYSRYFNTLIDIGAFESHMPVAVDDTAVAVETGSVAGSNATGDLVSNDVTTGVKNVTAIRIGSVEGSGTAGVVGSGLAGSYGTLTVAANGAFTYVPDDANATVNALQAGQSLVDAFNYTLSDGSLTDISVLTITLNGANDVPVAVNDTASATEDGASATGNLLTNDSDPEGSALSVTTGVGVTAGSYGTLTLAANGAFTYAPNNANATVDALQVGQSLTDTFTYTLSDGSLTTTATLTVTLNGANDVPVAVNDTASATEDGASATGNLLTNDHDVDSASLSVTGGVTAGSYGTLTLAANGAFTYAPDNSNATV
ncbi:MAG: DUF4347 domain-containing protein [Magnetococcales bacterium]|nr:DUF4347 domain-containing protein [Magnetococcales bacterium]